MQSHVESQMEMWFHVYYPFSHKNSKIEQQDAVRDVEERWVEIM